MVNSKRRLDEDSENEEELKEQIIASSSQLQAKRAKLANGSASNGAYASSTTTLRPTESDDEDEDVDELATPAPQVASTANGHRDVDMQAGDDDDDEDGAQRSDDDSSGDEQDEDNVRAKALSNKDQQKGRIAEAGVLNTVILKNFMCHRHMEVNLNPQINFIIGHNGSGKSVILTAITYVFGAKASVSNRGTSQGSFIREGAPGCEVTVSIRNRGEEAFKPEVYGKTIWLTRKTDKNGSGSYKLQNHNKKLVSSLRSELTALCDHFQIQVDNPINILHQDMAKLFLHSSKPTDKYKFFLKGTQLEQLADEYQVLFDKTQAVQAIARQKKERLVDLRDTMRQAHNAWREIEAVRNVGADIRKRKNELAWCHVVEIEKETQAAVNKQADEESTIERIGEKLAAAQKELDEATRALEQAEKDQTDDDAGETLNNELKEVTIKIREITAQISEARGEQREMQETIKALRDQITAREKELQEASSRADGPLRQRMLESRARLQEVEAKREQLTTKIEEARATAAEAARLFDEERPKFEAVKNDQGQARYAFEQAETSLRNIAASQENSLNRFGPHAAAIAAAIDRDNGWVSKPIGPLGNYIKLKDNRWAKTCEAVLGDRLNSYLVSNDQDRFRLNQLIKRFRGARHNVILSGFDEGFEAGLQHNIPDRHILTMLDILTFENQQVRQAFINVATPEACMLVTERSVGDDFMRDNDSRVTRIVACYTIDAYQVGGVRGGSRMAALNLYRGPPRLTKDMEAERQRALNAKIEAEVNLQRANNERARIDQLLSRYTQQKRQAESEASQASAKLRSLELEREKLREQAAETEPADVQAIEAARQAALEEVESVKAQGANSSRHVAELQASCKPYVERKEEIKTLLTQREAILNSRMEAIDGLVTVKTSKAHEVTQWKGKEEQHKIKLAKLVATVEEWAQRMQQAMDRASEMCPREQVDLEGKSVRKLEHAINSLERALRAQEERLGGSSEEIHSRYKSAKEEYEKSQNIVKELKACAAAMLTCYSSRMRRWTDLCKAIATRARMSFMRYLSNRGYSGDLRFKFDEGKLELFVQPNDEIIKKGQRSKDIATLSGGEKSFSTICLLLSLWSAAGCPIRGLDEYDVFMDPVNRRMATKMLIEAGQEANSTQMILISPQNISGFTNNSGVRIIKIADPERGQGTLATNTTG